MSARLNPFAVAPEMIAAMTAFETAVVSSGLEHSLIELVKIRASQINGCAIAVDFGGFVDPTALRARAA